MKCIFKNQQNTKDERLVSYIEHCREVVESKNYSAPEASLCLPSDTQALDTVKALVKKKQTPELKYVIVIGIGGSNLGTKAVYNALYGSIDQFTPNRHPKMIFMDTIDPKACAAVLKFIDSHITNANEYVVALISKSGTTTEPVVNAEMLLERLKNRFSGWKERCVIITDNGTKMWKEAQRIGIDILEIPHMVGGRYDVLTSVGLFPLLMAHINCDHLLKGAEKMREMCLSNSPDNYALSSSIFQYLAWKEGRGIHNNFYFHPELESLGKWYRQLMGESIGKDKKGITPMVSIGSVDHHSMVQLYFAGPEDKTTEIVYASKTASCTIPTTQIFPTLSTTQGKDTAEIMRAIEKGTAIVYDKLCLPYFEVVFDEINEYELGAYMQYKMIEMMYIAHLLEINAFDQLHVDLYKIETRKILDKK